MAGRNTSSVKLTGFKEIEAALLKLPVELAKIVEVDVLREGMIPVRKAAKAYAGAAKDSGLLQKSIGLNVRRVRRKLQYQNRYTARVGPQSGHRQMVDRTKTVKGKNGQTYTRKVREMADPVNYAHLVEYGTSHSAAKPFIRPAVESCESEILARMAIGYDKGMTKVIKRIHK